mgnify:CR=1 FL=1
MQKLTEQEIVRREKLKEISKEINIDMENATIDISDGNIKINKEIVKKFCKLVVLRSDLHTQPTYKVIWFTL